MNSKQLAQDFVDLLKQNAADAGKNLASDINEVTDYAATRMTHLSTIINEPGFREALDAETDSIALKAAGRTIDRADAFDSRIVGIVQGSLQIGARALAAIA